jgi:hypothetical protein
MTEPTCFLAGSLPCNLGTSIASLLLTAKLVFFEIDQNIFPSQIRLKHTKA